MRQKIEQIDRRVSGAEQKKAQWTRRLGPLAPVIFFIAKAKTYLFLLFKLKFLLSFLGFFAIYWALFGWKFGLGFTLAILLHEMGALCCGAVARAEGGLASVFTGAGRVCEVVLDGDQP